MAQFWTSACQQHIVLNRGKPTPIDIADHSPGRHTPAGEPFNSEPTLTIGNTPDAGPVHYAVDYTYVGSLDLTATKPSLSKCEQFSPLSFQGNGFRPLTYVPTGTCMNGEVDLYETNDSSYVVQAGGTFAAFALTDITDPTNPSFVGGWKWNPPTNTIDLRSFRQGTRRLLALAMESTNYGNGTASPCGIAIVDVTDANIPILVRNLHGTAIGSDASWCNVHTIQVASDNNGNGQFMLVASKDTSDLHVLDISNLENIREVNTFSHPHPSFDQHGRLNSFVQDTTVAGKRIYVSFWAGGVIVVDKQKLFAGAQPEAFMLTPPDGISPAHFKASHSFPTADGNYLFVQDFANFIPGYSQIRLFDIHVLAQPREVYEFEYEQTLSPPHLMTVYEDLLFVSWYLDGIRVFKLNVGDMKHASVDLVAFQRVREENATSSFTIDHFGGIVDLVVSPCRVRTQTKTCIYASDMTHGLLILTFEGI